jgi:hypothetical protein
VTWPGPDLGCCATGRKELTSWNKSCFHMQVKLFELMWEIPELLRAVVIILSGNLSAQMKPFSCRGLHFQIRHKCISDI